ncbi:MAG: hypothetical protein GVY17_01625 [Cyanobacteria bacterium]|jgi:hypothetical protein|nr:hypothetical protein [Cyanobacteria bacterium GSL.Bin21]
MKDFTAIITRNWKSANIHVGQLKLDEFHGVDNLIEEIIQNLYLISSQQMSIAILPPLFYELTQKLNR